MNTLAYILILVGIVIVRQVFKGRVMQLGTDLADSFTAFTTGDTAALTEIMKRTGTSNASSDASPVALTPDASQQTPGTANAATGLCAAAIKRGSAAKGYKWAATGPDYYDCSGLMWRACQDLGYTGPRFTTFTVGLGKQMTELAPPGTNGPFPPGQSAATVNDIVVWTAGHMGVISRPGYFYSARSVHSGIGESKIEGFEGGTRKYYRLVV